MSKTIDVEAMIGDGDFVQRMEYDSSSGETVFVLGGEGVHNSLSV